MATTIATSRDHVINLLLVVSTNFTTGGTTTNALIEDMLRREFKNLWSRVPPIFRGAFTVDANNEITIGNDLNSVLYLSGRRAMLIPEVEWSETEEGAFIFNTPDATTGDTAIAWYTTTPEIAYSGDGTPTTTIDSTCVLGPDWLEQAAEYGAAMQVLLRTSRDAASGSSDRDSTVYRVLEATYNQRVAELMSARERWLARMDGRLNARVQLGKSVVRDSDLPNFHNRSGFISRDTHFQTGDN